MRSGATFRLFGDVDHPARAVTARLGIEPTTFFEAGDAPVPDTVHRLATSGWLLTSQIETDTELGAHLAELLDVLEPVAAEMWRLVDGGYRANWFCFVGSNGAEHAVELDRDLLGRLLRLPGDLWLDVHGG